MMGMSGANASDFDKALSLLAALSDPKALADRIAAIRDAEAQAQAAIAQAAADAKTTEELRTLFEVERNQRIANLDAREGEITARENDLNRQRADLQRDKDAWVMVDAALKDDRKKLELAKALHAAEVTKAEDAIFARNSALDARSLKLDAKEQELDARDLALIDKETALADRIKLLNEATRPVREG